MKRVIGAQLAGEDLERFEALSDERAEGTSESELIRELLLDGIEQREVPLTGRLDVSQRVAAQIEADRELGESDEELVNRFLEEAVDARNEDALDAIGAGAELREAVETEREEGEELDETVRRLLRRSSTTDATSDTNQGRTVSAGALVGIFSLASAPPLLISGYTLSGAVLGVIFLTYALLWATASDVVVERSLNTAREKFAEFSITEAVWFLPSVIVGFFQKMIRDGREFDDPDTVVERCANAQVLAQGMIVAALIVAVPMFVFLQLVGADTVVEWFGTTGVWAWVVLFSALIYLAALFSSISAVAMLAIISSGEGSETVSPTDETPDAGE